MKTHSSPVVPGRYCNRCGQALPAGVRSEVRLPGADGQGGRWTVCAACRAVWLRCAGCGRALGDHNEAFLLVPDARRFYCTGCWARPRCDTCGLPLGAVSYERPDGRRMCDRCHLTAIYDPQRASALYGRVQQTISEVLALADRHSAGPLENDARQRCFGLYLRERHLRAIYVEYGLPQIVFCEVTAHEYAHAWQGENCPLLDDVRVREGFAEWVAYKVLEYWGCTRRLTHFQRRTDLYGQGLQLMLRWEAAGGAAGVVAQVQAPPPR